MIVLFIFNYLVRLFLILIGIFTNPAGFFTDLLWCAPEIIKQAEVASQKADVYSFGIILYEVIGKEGPFGKNYSYSDEELQGNHGLIFIYLKRFS